MAIQPDRKYEGVVAAGSSIVESKKGTLSFQVMIECEDGQIYYPIWLTPKNREKAIKQLEMLGADPDKLSNQTYLDLELGNVIAGKEISFGTKSEEYNGQTRVKVVWIGKRTDPNIIRGAAKFFGGAPDMADTVHDRGIDDSDIPF